MAISRENNRYYVSFSVIDKKPEPQTLTNREVEITFKPQDDDIFFATSLGRTEMKPKFILDYEREIGRIQRTWQRDRRALEKEKIEKLKESNTSEQVEEVEKLYEGKIRQRQKKYLHIVNNQFAHIKNRRKDYIGIMVDYFTTTFDKIIIRVPKFQDELSHSKTKLPRKREHNKVLLDSRGNDFVTALMAKAVELSITLEAKQVD